MVTILNASTLEWVHGGKENRVKSTTKLNNLLGRSERPLSPTSRSFLAFFRKYHYSFPVTDVPGVGSKIFTGEGFDSHALY